MPKEQVPSEKDCSEYLRRNSFLFHLVKELEDWVKSMYLLEEEFEHHKAKAYKRASEKSLQDGGW